MDSEPQQQPDVFDSKEDTLTIQNPYEKSAVVAKAKEQLANGKHVRLIFADVDSTLVGAPKKHEADITPGKREVDTTTAVRNLLEEQHYGVALVTARTEEMVLDEEARNLSPDFTRPVPKLGKNEYGLHTYVDPRDVETAGILNPDIVAGSTGAAIVVRQEDGSYTPDTKFQQKMQLESGKWRETTHIVAEKIMASVNKDGDVMAISKDEDHENYEKGVTNIAPPDYRMALEFKNEEAKLACAAKLRELRKLALAYKPILEDPQADRRAKDEILAKGFTLDVCDQLFRYRLTDDSNPDKGKYAYYLTPKAGFKARAVQEAVDSMAQTLAIDKSAMDVLIAGDGFPDLTMGLYGALGTNVTFLVANGSRLESALSTAAHEKISDQAQDDEIAAFAGEPLSAIKRRFEPTDQTGIYTFHTPLFGDRKVVLLGEIYPEDSAPEGIRDYLESQS
jgi:hydroxymethylpyrimidine pyrophosphatase-like HAD family hydrolase